MKRFSLFSKVALFFSFLFFSLISNSQTLNSVNPNNGQIGQFLTVQISGSSVDFTTGSSSIQTNFKRGSTSITAPTLAVDPTGTILDVSLDLSNTSLPSGLYNLEVTTQTNGLLTLANAFRIDTTALISTTPQMTFKGQTVNVLIAARALDFNTVTTAPYYFRNNDTIWTTIVQPRTRANDTLEITLDLTSATVRAGNYDMQVMTPGGVLFLRNALEVKTTNISGTVFFDINQDNIQDLGEPGISSVNLKLLPSGVLSYSNSNGDFQFNDLGSGTYRVVAYPPNGSSTTLADTQTVVLNSFSSKQIAVGLTNNTQYLIGLQSSALRARCGGLGQYQISIRNRGNAIIDGIYYFVKDSLLTFSSSSIAQADSVNGDTIFYSYTNLTPFDNTSRIINCNLPSITILPINTLLKGKTTAYIIDGGGNPVVGTDTSQIKSHRVRCSYDPNDKLVDPIGTDSGGFVSHNTPLEYTIRFQNTGNDTAYRVVVLDTLSTNLDLSTFQFLDASHPVITELKSGGELSFTFDNIFLVDSNTNEPASNGFVRFRLSPNQGLADSTEVTNKAAIYFDFNPPIITNEVKNTFSNLITSLTENKTTLKASVSPNPSNGLVNIKLKESLINGELRIYNLSGKEVYLRKYSKTKAIDLNISSLSNGIYILSIVDGDKIYTEKLIIGK